MYVYVKMLCSQLLNTNMLDIRMYVVCKGSCV